MSGTDIASMSLRACYEMSSTGIAYAADSLRACFDMSSTDRVYCVYQPTRAVRCPDSIPGQSPTGLRVALYQHSAYRPTRIFMPLQYCWHRLFALILLLSATHSLKPTHSADLRVPDSWNQSLHTAAHRGWDARIGHGIRQIIRERCEIVRGVVEITRKPGRICRNSSRQCRIWACGRWISGRKRASGGGDQVCGAAFARGDTASAIGLRARYALSGTVLACWTRELCDVQY
eukprot:2113814-Rhodomonas_salina.3